MLKNNAPVTATPVAAGPVFCRGAECSAGSVEGRVVCGGDGQVARAAERERSMLTQKTALEIVLRRALLRGERDAEASRVSGPAV